jgi:hypothetical protein
MTRRLTSARGCCTVTKMIVPVFPCVVSARSFASSRVDRSVLVSAPISETPTLRITIKSQRHRRMQIIDHNQIDTVINYLMRAFASAALNCSMRMRSLEADRRLNWSRNRC